MIGNLIGVLGALLLGACLYVGVNIIAGAISDKEKDN